MIYSINGIIDKVDDNFAVFQAGGIGYKVFCSASMLGSLKRGGKKKIFCHYFPEKGELYGFANEDDLDMFSILLSANGIGPKNAIKVLNALSSKDLKSIILLERADVLSERGGISKKNAQKIILDLKNKIKKGSSVQNKSNIAVDEFEVAEILKSLGYSKNNIDYALTQIDKKAKSLQDKVKSALRSVANKNN